MKPTNEFRWLTTSTPLMEDYEDGSYGMSGSKESRVLQQKFISPSNDIEWRDVPEVYEDEFEY